MILLTNAFEAIDQTGTVTITTDSHDEKITIDIADTGRGIPSDELKRLFDIRLQTGGVRVKAGFGMAACQSIVRHHHGQIEVESKVNRGTRFKIVLPVG